MSHNKDFSLIEAIISLLIVDIILGGVGEVLKRSLLWSENV